MAKQNKAFEFGPFRLEVHERRLTRDGHVVPLRGRVFDTLYVLVSRHGSLVTKDELMAIIWPDSVVEESNLNHNICVLRRALGDKVTGQKYIETIPRQGYRFVADVRELDGVETSAFPYAWDIPEKTLSDHERQTNATASPAEPPAGASSRRPWHHHQGLISSLAVGLLLIVGYFGAEQFPFVGSSADSRIMVAVLPFENLTGDPLQKYVADGLTYEIIAQFGRLNTARIGVIARTSTEVYRKARKSIDEIGSELGVDYVVEGSLRRSENSYRITVILIRVNDQAHLWAANYSRQLGNTTALQIEIARIVVNQFGRRIGVEPDANFLMDHPKGKEIRADGLESCNTVTPPADIHSAVSRLGLAE